MALLSSSAGRISYLYLLQSVWSYLGDRKPSFLASYAMFGAANGVKMLEPLILARILNVIQQGSPTLVRDVTLLLALYFSITLVFWMFHGSARIIERTNAFYVHKRSTEHFFRLLNRLPLKWHRTHHTGEIMNRVQKATGALFKFSGNGYEYLQTIIKFAVSMVAIILFLPLTGSLALLAGGLLLTMLLRFNKKLLISRRKIIDREHKVMSALVDYIGNITTVITLRLERAAEHDLGRRLKKVLPEYRYNIRLNEFKWFCISMLVSFTTFALLVLYVRQQYLATGMVLVGSLMALYQYMGTLAESFFRMAGQIDEVDWAATDVRSIDPIKSSDFSPSNRVKPKSSSGDWNIIEIENLRFSYGETTAKHQLQDISLTLRRGSTVAVIGESGSGKSTLMTVLRGLEHPEDVLVRVDNQEYRDLSPLTSITTLIPQQPELFESTVCYNITTGSSVHENDLLRACDIARFTPVLERIPRGLKAHIQERGVNMSGGERQRLALARGILAARDSSLILLDEPTSAVDPANELAIYKELFSHYKDRCIVSSIHRLHLLPLFDEVVVMDKGSVIEYGSFTDLVTREDGKLRQLWDRYHAKEEKVNVVSSTNMEVGSMSIV